MNNKKLLIFGNTTFAATLCDYFTDYSDYEVVAFTVNREYISEPEYYGHPVVPFEDLEQLYPPDEYDVFVAIGSSRLNQVRETVFNMVHEKGYHMPSFVHPRACVSTHVQMGENCLIMEFAHVQTRAKLGNGVIVNGAAYVSHDAQLDDFVYFVGACAGFVKVGRRSFIGFRSCIADHVNIGEDNFVAMAAVVTRSTGERRKVSGHPAMDKELNLERLCKFL